MSKKKGFRRRGRESAFGFLYAMSFADIDDGPGLKRSFDLCPKGEEDQVPQEVADFAWELVQGVFGKRDELDKLINDYSQNWKLSRIARVELAILRLSLFEMIYSPDIPLKVAINEAVELSKRYGDENSRSFVNGILDAVARAVMEGKFGIHKEF